MNIWEFIDKHTTFTFLCVFVICMCIASCVEDAFKKRDKDE